MIYKKILFLVVAILFFTKNSDAEWTQFFRAKTSTYYLDDSRMVINGNSCVVPYLWEFDEIKDFNDSNYRLKYKVKSMEFFHEIDCNTNKKRTLKTLLHGSDGKTVDTWDGDMNRDKNWKSKFFVFGDDETGDNAIIDRSCIALPKIKQERLEIERTNKINEENEKRRIEQESIDKIKAEDELKKQRILQSEKETHLREQEELRKRQVAEEETRKQQEIQRKKLEEEQLKRKIEKDKKDQINNL